MIPRILHQIWLGEEPFPEQFEGYQQSWMRNHPDWDFRFWAEDDVPGDLVRPEVYDRMRSPVERSDILRLELLNREGGVYVDADFESLRPLDPLIEGVEFFCAYLRPDRVNNAIIGSVPGHPLLIRALAEMAPRQAFGYSKEAAGPVFFDRLIRDFPEITIFEKEAFYPRTPTERRDAIAVHHQARAWKPRDLLMGDIERAEEKLGQTQDRLRETEQLNEALLAKIERLEAGKRGFAIPPSLRVAGTRVAQRWTRLVGGAGRTATEIYDRRSRNSYATSLDRVPSRDELPELLNQRGLRGEAVQIGLGDATFADTLLTRWSGARLYCVVEAAGAARPVAKRHPNRTVIWQMPSREAAEQLANESLDFVYLQTTDASSLQSDLDTWLPKLRPGGIIAGSLNGHPPPTPEQASLHVHTTTGARRNLQSWLAQVPQR
ncbi:MAG TPA: glycosyltransferase [Gaiellaceae bacterium]